jgi:hypothetical protein
LLALIAFSMLATARTTRIDLPVPQCDPCPFVR